MSVNYFISDLHLGHENIRAKTPLRAARWNDVYSMDKELLERINDTVPDKPNNRLILGGDICWNTRSFKNLEKIACKNVILVGGNHDTSSSHYKAYRDAGWRIVGCYQMQDVIVSHIPVHPYQVEYTPGYDSHAPEGEPRFKYNIHGHTHDQYVLVEEKFKNVMTRKQDKRYLNMSCEAIDFTPKTYEQLLEHYGLAQDYLPARL